MRVLDVFAGIGGMSLGLQRAGMEIVGQCEIEPFCRAVLAKHWPDVWRHDDVRTLTADAVQRECGSVDLVCGGVPCQPASVAGKRLGAKDDRWLWPEFLRLVRGVGPRWVIAENVPGLTSLGDECEGVFRDLEAAGYEVWPLIVGADDIGAPHRRKRLWIVANTDDGAATRLRQHRGCCNAEPATIRFAGSRYAVGHALRTRPQERQGERRDDGEEQPPAERAGYLWPVRPGEQQHEWEQPRLVYTQRDGGRQCAECEVGSPASRLPARLVRFANRNALRAYGNAVVPACVEAIGRAIMQVEKRACHTPSGEKRA